MKLDDAIRAVARARKRLAGEQGRLARKNARAAVKAAVATTLRAMDREYPLIAKERVVRASMSPVAKKRRERAKNMMVTMITEAEALVLANAGIKVSGVRDPLVLKAPNGTRKTAQPLNQTLWVPNWAARALRGGVGVEEIKRAVRSRSVRRRVEAVVRLRPASTPMKTIPF